MNKHLAEFSQCVSLCAIALLILELRTSSAFRPARTLMRLTPRLPAGWAEQRKLLGFAENTSSIQCSVNFRAPTLASRVMTLASPDVGYWLRPRKKVTHEMAPERFS
jgi:hypothetical protein